MTIRHGLMLSRVTSCLARPNMELRKKKTLGPVLPTIDLEPLYVDTNLHRQSKVQLRHVYADWTVCSGADRLVGFGKRSDIENYQEKSLIIILPAVFPRCFRTRIASVKSQRYKFV